MQPSHSKSFHYLASILILTIASFFSSCAPQTQVSSLQSYNGPLSSHGTNQCFVTKTALDSKFTETINKYKDYIQGDSHIELAGRHYEIVEAAFDCMYVGAKSVMILDRGVTSTNSGSTFTTFSSTNHYQSTNSSTTFSTTYSNPSKNFAYTIVFFNKKIPEFGNMITMSDYESWKKANRMKNCIGCK